MIRNPSGASAPSARKASMVRPLTAPASYSCRPTSQGGPLVFKVLDRGNTRVRIGDKMRREVDINIPHRHHLTGILEATLYLYIGKRRIPRQIDLVSDKCLNQGIVVRVEQPVEFDAMPKKMLLESSEYTDVSWRRRPTEPHHT